MRSSGLVNAQVSASLPTHAAYSRELKQTLLARAEASQRARGVGSRASEPEAAEQNAIAFPRLTCSADASTLPVSPSQENGENASGCLK